MVQGTFNAVLQKRRCLFSIRCVILVAFALRLTIFLVACLISPDTSGFYHRDTESYLKPAVALVYKGQFASDGVPEIFRTPGYPLLLVPGILLGHLVLVTVLLQIILSCATVYLIYQSARLLLGRDDVAGFGALLYALDPFSSIYANKLASESLSTFLVALFLHEFLMHLRTGSWIRLLSSAVALSASVYVRPIGYYLPLCVTAAYLTWILIQARRRARLLLRAAVFLLVSVGLIGAWQIRNYQQARYTGFSTVSDFNLYFYYAAAVQAVQEGIPLRVMQTRLGGVTVDTYLQIHPDQRGWSEAARSNYMHREALKIIVEHPLLYARMHLRSMFVILVSPYDYEQLTLFHVPHTSALGFSDILLREGFLRGVAAFFQKRPPGFYGVLILGVVLWSYLILAGLGLISLRSMTGMSMWVALVVGAYFAVLPGGPHADSRYRQPLMLIICIFAGYGWHLMAESFNRYRATPALMVDDSSETTVSS